jgi:hypothetical protein
MVDSEKKKISTQSQFRYATFIALARTANLVEAEVFG